QPLRPRRPVPGGQGLPPRLQPGRRYQCLERRGRQLDPEVLMGPAAMGVRGPLAWFLAAQVLLLGCSTDDGIGVPLRPDLTDIDARTDAEPIDLDEDAPEACLNAPTVSAGVGGDAIIGDSIDLDGDASDPDADDTLTYTWTQTGGPAADISDESSPDGSFELNVDADEAGETVTFELQVCD